uniref:Large ribosomal subunit protein bL32c n=1 Tax=Rhodogorgon sp. TaxID=2485824 RepID=A0A3G3MI93_9FLOR|nr:ribosomal protein L32 [Rhodogorgon sp.]
MAVPKKRTSKAKSRSRKASWKRKAYYAGKKAWSLARSSLSTKSHSYVYVYNNLSQNKIEEI